MDSFIDKRLAREKAKVIEGEDLLAYVKRIWPLAQMKAQQENER
jgi:hypothetical protein